MATAVHSSPMAVEAFDVKVRLVTAWNPPVLPVITTGFPSPELLIGEIRNQYCVPPESPEAV